jgi:The GLUG motif
MCIRQNLVVSLVLAISMVGVSYGASGDLPGDGLSESTAYLIEDLADFDVFADQANSATYWASGVYTKLVCDIDLTGKPPYTTAVIAPEGSSYFEGVFDGNGHVVSNLTIDTMSANNNYLGLFGKIEGSGAEIENLGLENADITGGSNSLCLGGLCGYNYCGAITNCYAAGAVTGGDYLGGLCGFNSYGTITSCYAIGAITGNNYLGGLCGDSYRGDIGNCYATAAVTGGNYLGGLCGSNEYGTIGNCYATGAVTGGDYLGGLCGFNRHGIITNCFWDIETGGPDNGIGTPETTGQMQMQNTFTNAGWDFVGESANGTDDIWDICEGTNSPKFSWQIPPVGDFVCSDGVDLTDFAVLAETWGLSSGQAGYNELCDLIDDNTIYLDDLAVFVENWLAGK